MKVDRDFIHAQSKRMAELLLLRGNLPREDLEYTVQAVAKLKDERLKACVAELIGWGDEERAELETFVAIALEVMKRTNVSKLRDCARIVELRFLTKQLEKEKDATKNIES